MHQLFLDLFIDSDQGLLFAQQAARDLEATVKHLASHVDLQVNVYAAVNSVPWNFDWQGQAICAVRHEPKSAGHQSILITDHPISGACGWGTINYGVVSKSKLQQKVANRGNAIDILIHEWIHTIQGVVINGRPVPFADHAQNHGFSGVRGSDGEDRWDDWYSYALGR